MKDKEVNYKNLELESKGQFEHVFELSPDCMFKVSLKDFKLIAANTCACTYYGYTKEAFKKLYVRDIELDKETRKIVTKASKSYPIGKVIDVEGLAKRKDGSTFPTQVRFCKLDEDYALAILRDITTQKEIEVLNQELSKALETTEVQNRRLELNKDVLALVIQHRPLAEIMNRLCLKMESILDGGKVSVFLLSSDGKHLNSLAAPSMDSEFNEELDGMSIGMDQGACGAAAYSKKQVFVEDVETSIHTIKYEAFLLSYNLRSCWSIPIISSEQVVLGTFAVFFETKRQPNVAESELLNIAGDLAAIAIEQDYYQSSLKKINAEYITQNKELEEAKLQLELDKEILIKSQEKLEEAQRFSRVGHWEFDFLSYKLLWSKEQYRVFELEGIPDDKLYEAYKNRVHPEDVESLRKAVAQGIQSGKEFKYEHRIICEDQRIKFIMGFGKVIFNADGTPAKMKGTEQDVTELKEAQEAALEQERKLNELLANINETVFAVDLRDDEKYDNPITYINGDTLSIFGYTNKELMAVSVLWSDRIHPDDLEEVLEVSKTLHQTQKQVVREYRFRHKKGHYIWIEDNISLGNAIDGAHKVLYGSVRDITERKAAEAALMESQISNEEKDVLLKEIHHRVKNNLQVITSLLSLQSSFLDNEEQKKLFADSQYRINSMAIVHEMLYQSDNLSKVNYERYLKELSQFLIRSMKGNDNNIELLMDVPNINLSMDTAIPLGLLINEILTNSLKYGFNDRAEGQISIKITPKTSKDSAATYFQLEIGDNGIGYPADLNFRNSKSLGLKLITNLTRQLEGTIERNVLKKGTNYIISFKEI